MRALFSCLRRSRVLGAHAAFLLSGVMHEYIWLLAAFTPGALSPGLGWLVYFLIQAPIMTAERTVGKVRPTGDGGGGCFLMSIVACHSRQDWQISLTPVPLCVQFLVHRFRIRLPRAAITSLALLWCATVGHLTFLRAARAGGVSQVSRHSWSVVTARQAAVCRD